MYVKDECNYEILKRAEDMLDTTFNWQTNDDDFKGFVHEDYFQIIDNLCSLVDGLQEQLEDQKEHYEQLIRDCYKPISPYEFYGVSEHDF